MSQSVITFIVTQNCQLACKYCYLVGKNSKEQMQFATAKQIVDCILTDQTITSTDDVVFDFIGGEPLLEIDLIANIMDYICDTMSRMNHKWKNSYGIRIITNGLRYNEESVQKFIFKYKELLTINISIDGTKEKHDANRIMPNGQGSYDKVIDNIKLWITQFPEVSTNMVISHEDVQFVYESLKHLIKLGIKSIEVNPVGQDVWKEGDDKIFEEQLIMFADYIIDNNLWGDVNISVFSNSMGSNAPKDVKLTPCGNMSLSVDAKGNFYSCIRFAKYSLAKRKPLIVGNIKSGIDPNRLRPFMLMYRDIVSPKECVECEVNTACKWCPADSYDDSLEESIFVRTTYACSMHKAKVRAKNYYFNKLKSLEYYNG